MRSLERRDESRMDTGTDGVQIIRNVPAFLAFAREWRDLCNKVPQHYFTQSFDWCRGRWEEVTDPRGRRLYCLVARQDQCAVLIWPLVMYRNRFWPFARPLGRSSASSTPRSKSSWKS